LAISGCESHFKSELRRDNMEKLRTKILALNVDFDGLSFDFLGSRKLRKKASKSDTPVKIVILPLLASLS